MGFSGKLALSLDVVEIQFASLTRTVCDTAIENMADGISFVRLSSPHKYYLGVDAVILMRCTEAE